MVKIMEIFIDLLESLGTIVALAALGYQIYKNREDDSSRQAMAVAAWIIGGRSDKIAEICISNLSDLPIYDVVVSRDIVIEENSREGVSLDNCTYIQVVPPGTYKVEAPSHGGGMNKIYGASITFRDVRGVNWSRNATGKIIRIRENSIDYRKLKRPVGSSHIEKLA